MSTLAESVQRLKNLNNSCNNDHKIPVKMSNLARRRNGRQKFNVLFDRTSHITSSCVQQFDNIEGDRFLTIIEDSVNLMFDSLRTSCITSSVKV